MFLRSLSSNFNPQLSYNLGLVPVGCPVRNYFTVYCLNFSLLLCLNISVIGKLQAEYYFAQEDSSKYLPIANLRSLSHIIHKDENVFFVIFPVESNCCSFDNKGVSVYYASSKGNV